VLGLRARAVPGTARPSHYKWIVLSNTTLGVLMATIDMSIMLIALPDIFRGIGIDPLTGRSFFPELISGSFASGLHTAFDFAIAACLAAAGMSWLRGGKYHYHEEAEPAAPAQELKGPVGPVGPRAA
jgi:hypothetical protein